MKKEKGKNIDLVDSQDYQTIYTDLAHLTGQAAWLHPILDTALKYNIVTRKRTTFEPERSTTRAEAYGMIMSAVCMSPSDSTD